MMYRMVRVLMQVALKVFFRHIRIHGARKVPAQGPVLLVANHPNGLLDPFFFAISQRRRVWLTAKATLLEIPLLSWFMRKLNVIPLRRRQDLRPGEKADNSQSLGKAVDLMKQGETLCIFPEGITHNEPGLKPFRTGAARIALEAFERGVDVTVIPISLHFDNKDHFRSDAYVEYGDGFSVKEWARGAAQADSKSLTAYMESRVHALSETFNSRREQWMMTWAAELMELKSRAAQGGEEPFLARRVQKVVSIKNRLRQLAPWRLASLKVIGEEVMEYRRELRHRKVEPSQLNLSLSKRKAAWFALKETLVAVTAFPPAALGLIFHLPVALMMRFFGSMAKYKSHRATVTIIPGILLYPLYYATVAYAGIKVVSPMEVGLFLSAMPFMGYLGVLYVDRIRDAVRMARTWLFFRVNPLVHRDLVERGTVLVRKLESLEARFRVV